MDNHTALRFTPCQPDEPELQRKRRRCFSVYRDKGPGTAGHGRAPATGRCIHETFGRGISRGDDGTVAVPRQRKYVRGLRRAHAAAAAASTPIQWRPWGAAHDAGRQISRTARRTPVPRRSTAEKDRGPISPPK